MKDIFKELNRALNNAVPAILLILLLSAAYMLSASI